jgi:Transposase domain (DUF772)
LLKHIYGLSDEDVCASGLSDEDVCDRWVYAPYFQRSTGEEYFQHEFPHERSALGHWRKRLGEKLELLLAESLRVAQASGVLRTKDLARPRSSSASAAGSCIPSTRRRLHQRASRVRCEGFPRHHQCPGTRRPIRAAR